MQTQAIYQKYGEILYLFILKKVKNKEIANDVLQNTFLKIHKNLPQLKNRQKAKAWVFQIARNELTNYFSEESKYVETKYHELQTQEQYLNECCCFDHFLDQLPPKYKVVIDQVYIKGAKQQEAANTLGLSLANVKARIRKSKALLKQQFMSCCNYRLDGKGKLVGQADCLHCQP